MAELAAGHHPAFRPMITMPDLSRLTPNQRQILALLAQGHTVKSAAARLELSEGAVNERLREVRRKTGVGSSRELARLLPQETWDEEIGMAKAAGAVDPERRRTLSTTPSSILKGATMIALASAVGAVTALAMSSQAAAPPKAKTPPHVVATSPAAGARVKAGKLALTVTFDRPMGPGYSFIMRDRASFPTCDPAPTRSADRKSFTLACVVEAGRAYEVGFNSPRHANFVSEDGLPAAPARLRFSAR
jgi:DNA-binding CsgD family transcriptional regulator/methionine-rich copper-binding protein CopC